MSEAVADHSCLYLQNKIIVVGGGRKCFGCEVRTEIFDLHKKTRKYGGKLSKPISHAAMLKSRPSSKYAAFFIGGMDDFLDVRSEIFGLTHDLSEFDIIGNLKMPRFAHIALVLPEELKEHCFDES